MAEHQQEASAAAPQMVARMALSYPKVKFCFVDPDNIAYSFGRGLRISNLGKNAKIPRGIYGVNPWNGDFLWSDTKHQRGFSAFTFNWKMGLAAVAPRTMNPSIEIMTWPDHTRKYELKGGPALEYAAVALSRGGGRCAGLGNAEGDRKLVVFETPVGGEKKEARKLAEAALPAPCDFLSFDPGDEDLLCAGGAAGLYLWRLGTLLEDHVLAVTKFLVPDDEDGAPEEGGPVDASRRSLAGRGGGGGGGGGGVDASRRRSAAGSAAVDAGGGAAQDARPPTDKFEELTNRGRVPKKVADANHITAHAWGTDSRLFVATRAGALFALQLSKEKGPGAEVLARHRLAGAGPPGGEDGPAGAPPPPRGGQWQCIHLAYTDRHLVAVGSDGISRWLDTKKFEEEKLAVCRRSKDGAPTGPPLPAVAAAHSPGYDSLVVGTATGGLYVCPLVFDRSQQEEKETYGLAELAAPGPAAEPMALVQDFGAGRVTGLAVISTSGRESKALIATASDRGELRLWSELSGHVVWSRTLEVPVREVSSTDDPQAPPAEKEERKGRKGRGRGNKARSGAGAGEGEGGGEGEAAAAAPTVPLPITAMSSLPNLPLLAVGTATGHIYIFYLTMEGEADAGSHAAPQVRCLVRQRLFRSSVTHLCIHSQMPFVAAASSDDNKVYALELSPQRPFYVCSYAQTPNGQPVTSLMWRGLSLLYCDNGGYLNTLNLKVTGGPPPPAPAAPSWRIRLVEPLCSMYSFMCLPTAPFMALSADNPNLQVYAPMPEEAPQKVQPLLPPFNSMEAHGRGSLAMAFAPDNTLLATGGVDGSVSLWNFSEHAVHRADALQVHSSAVVQLVFSLDSRRIYSAAVDGSVIGVVIDGAQGRETKVSMALSMRAEMTLEVEGPKDLPALAAEPLWVEARVAKLREAQAMEVEAHRAVQRENLQELAQRFLGLVHRNNTLGELERLDREAFVVDVAGRARALAAAAARAAAARAAARRANVGRGLVAARLRALCWDSMEVHAQEVLAFQREGALARVRNFPVRRRPPAEVQRAARVRRLRALELCDVRLVAAKAAAAAGDPAAAAAARQARAWPRLTEELPPGLAWLVNEGELAPREDVVAQLQAQEAEAKERKKPGGKGGGGGDGGGGGKKGGGAGKKDGGDGGAAEDPDGDEEGAAAAGAAAAAASAVAAGEDLEEEQGGGGLGRLGDGQGPDVAALLYPPVALRTPRQRRAQAVLLQELVREMKLRFNAHFDKLYSDKEDEAFKIRTLNARIKEILVELRSDEEYFEPQFQNCEIPDFVLQVEGEVQSAPYEPAEARARRAAAEAEKKRREEAARGEDQGARALRDMMDGTLEVKKDATDLEAALLARRPEFQDEVPEDEWTPEMHKQLADYEAEVKAFHEEQEKTRKALELELKKLRTEVADAVKLFDDRVAALAAAEVKVREAVATQELFRARLGAGLVAQEVAARDAEALEGQLKAVRAQEAAAREQVAAFQTRVAAHAEAAARVAEEDKAIERNFRKEITETANKPINQDDFKKIIKLFKQRDGSQAYGEEGADSSGFGYSSTGYGTSKGMSRSNRESRRTSKMRQSAAQRRSVSKRASRLQSSRSRQSKGGVSSASAGMGPLQQAMREAMAKAQQEVKVAEDDPWNAADAAADRERVQKALEEADGVEPLSQEVDAPEGFAIEDQVWNKLQELRAAKVRKERELARRRAAQEGLEAQLGGLRAAAARLGRRAAALAAERAELAAAAALAERNLGVLVRLKQGQDEVKPEAVVTDYGGAALLPADLVRQKNAEILAAGGEKVKILNKIKNFRKSINYLQWEKNHLQVRVRDLEEYFTDLQLLRVTKDLQAVLKGDAAETDKKVVERYEAKTRLLTAAHADRARKLQAANARALGQVREREAENERLRAQYDELERSVAVRRSIHRTRADGATAPGATGGTAAAAQAQAAAARMKRITLRRRLIDLARAQTEEIEALRLELDRLRQRTFPSFAHAARTRLAGNPDEEY